MKVVNKVTVDTDKVNRIISATYDLYKVRPQYSCLLVRDTDDSFHLVGPEDQKSYWYELFIDSVVDYAVSHGILITGEINKDKILFKSLKEGK